MKVDLEFLKLKKEIFIREAEKIFEIQKNAISTDHNYLVRALANGPDHIKGNIAFTFVQKCINHTDDIYDMLKHEEPHARCDIRLNTNVIEFWQKLNKKYKKIKPERGDVIVGHYNRKDRIVMDGFLGIVKSVDANLNMEIIEASVISIYDDEPEAQRFDGLKVRTRGLAGKGKCRILGVFTPWFF